MNVPGEVIKAMAMATFEEEPSEAVLFCAMGELDAALAAAASLGWVMVPTRGPEFVAAVDRACSAWFGSSIWEKQNSPTVDRDRTLNLQERFRADMRAALLAAVSAQGES